MATINLGAIKFNWKGAYNSSTSYAVDDVVSSGGNSYVCIQAHSNQAVGNATAYWNIMSSAGTNGSNGTDLTSTLSARGDLVFKGASALTRLPKGTAGYYLKQGANDPEWSAVSAGGILQYKHAIKTDTQLIQSNNFGGTLISGLSVAITPSSASNKILVKVGIQFDTSNGYRSGGYIFRNGTKLGLGTGVGSRTALTFGLHSVPNQHASADQEILDAPNSTSAITYTVGVGSEGSGNGSVSINRDLNDSNDATHGRMSSYISATEISGGIL